MNTMVDTRHRLPATEALNRDIERREMPRPRRRRKLGSSPQEDATKHKISFDMADLVEATGPVEEDIAFPKIEWTLDDEEESDHQVPSLEDFHSSHSSPMLGKRTRRHYHHRLVRSKSVKSLCYLAEDSISCRKLEPNTNGGSWGQFATDSNEEDEDKSPIRQLNSADQANPRITPFLVLCAFEQEDFE